MIYCKTFVQIKNFLYLCTILPKKQFSNPMPTLSKSEYTTACQCLKALWLRTYKKEVETIDVSLQTRLAAGNEVGNLAKLLFGDFVDTTSHKADGSLDISAMITKTKQFMADGCEVICEAAFSYPNHYCAVDILRKTSNGWAIYEVKSTTSKAGAPLDEKKFSKYATDIAYQRWVIEQCGVIVTGTYLVTLNSDYVLKGELNIHQLFNVIDLSPLVENEYLKVPTQTKLALATLDPTNEPITDLSANCKSPDPCPFWEYCTKYLPNPSVFDIYGSGCRFDKKLKFYQEGKWSFEDLAQEAIGNIPDLQIHCTLDNTDYINPDGIKEFLDKITYPLYFLDFESMQPVLPQYDGTRPYMQICFQYSLHYIEHEGGKLKHTAFLAESNGQDPRRALAEALCRDIPRNVCTMAYNDNFEKTRIKEMAEAYPDLADHLMNIHDHIIDLLVPFRAGHYYRPAMGGSFSIKSVLPALFPDDPEMDYHNLPGKVHNGGDAMTIFPQIKDMSPEEALQAREDLLAYCHLDTFAMVRVWERLVEIAK